MSTAEIAAMIGPDQQIIGHDVYAYPNYANLVGGFEPAPAYAAGPQLGGDLATVIGSRDFARYPATTAPQSVGQLIDQPVDGHTGAAWDGPPTVAYRADKPGFGGFNDQPMFSGETNFSPGVDPSAEVGTGKPPGWVAAHFPVAQGVNPPRSSYAWQGQFADGENYHIDDGGSRERSDTMRPPWWPATLNAPGQSPGARYMPVGSAVMEQAPALTMSQIVGRITGGVVPGWGIQ